MGRRIGSQTTPPGMPRVEGTGDIDMASQNHLVDGPCVDRVQRCLHAHAVVGVVPEDGGGVGGRRCVHVRGPDPDRFLHQEHVRTRITFERHDAADDASRVPAQFISDGPSKRVGPCFGQ